MTSDEERKLINDVGAIRYFVTAVFVLVASIVGFVWGKILG